jgi:hypothetical protein
MKIRSMFALAVLSLVAISLFAQQTIHVPTDVATIQGAINAANTGDTVQVAAGTYFEHIDFKGKAITVASASGAAATILDGQLTSVPVVTFQTGEPSTAVLRGFTVRNGGASFGSGVYLLGTSPTITDNIFDSNNQASGGYGAGIGGNVASPDIERNLFRNNSCDSQWLSGVISFINTSSPVIANNVIVGNNCRGINMTLPAGSLPVVMNNTIVGNPVGIRVDARVAQGATLYENNIIVGNTVGLQVDFLVAGNEPTWKYNLLYNNTTHYSGVADQTGANGNLVADPLFVNSPVDLHLTAGATAGSPAIDVGDNAVPRLPRTDFDGKPRVVDGTNACTAVVDLGAYEFQAAPQAALAPSSLTFGSQLVGTSSAAQTASLSNTGTTCMHITGFATTDNFSETNTCGATLAAGQSCGVSMVFSPTAAGTRTGALSVSSDSPTAAVLSLVGTGTAPAATLAPTALIFGAQLAGSTSAPQQLTLSNTGTASLSISGIATAGDFYQTNNCGTSLAAGAACTISVYFAPSARGLRTGTLTVASNSSTATPAVSLSGTGIGSVVTLAPTALTFAAQTVGTTSPSQTFTLTNSGDAPLHISAIAATGDFAQVNNCSATLAATAFCSFTVTFKPAMAGARAGAVVISDDAFLSQQQSVPLAGTGVDFAVSATPASVTVNAGGPAVYTVVVSAVGGTFASSVSLGCSGLPASASCTFSPASVASVGASSSATMTIATAAQKGKKGTPSGTSAITITGNSGTLAHSAIVTLVVK